MPALLGASGVFEHIIHDFLCFQGMLCLPYLSLQYLDVIQDHNLRGFVIGATNQLFKQKSQLFDVVVEVTEISIH